MDLQTHFADRFVLDPAIDYLNHGSFGACPRAVLDAQARMRHELERGPSRFLGRELLPKLDAARSALATLLDAQQEQLVFVSNATTGVNIVLASLPLQAGDELLMTNHTYNACKNALGHWAEQRGASVVTAELPFPLRSEDEVLAAIEAKLSARTRLLLIDHITSPTGLVMPVERICARMRERGVAVLVDGAHAPGQVPLSLRTLGADYYTGNCHKWLCTPKGSAFLYVAREHAASVRPLVISHGAKIPSTDRPRLWLEHDWVGTLDPTPYLCIPEAITFLDSLLPGGLPALQARNRALALHARKTLCAALAIDAPAPESMIAALAAVPLPEATSNTTGVFDPLQARLHDAHGFEVIVSYFPHPPARLLRVCAQAYNHAAQYQRLAEVLVGELSAPA